MPDLALWPVRNRGLMHVRHVYYSLYYLSAPMKENFYSIKHSSLQGILNIAVAAEMFVCVFWPCVGKIVCTIPLQGSSKKKYREKAYMQIFN